MIKEKTIVRKKNRTILATSNKYQSRIVLLTFIPTFLVFFFFTSLVILMSHEMTEVFLHSTPVVWASLINRWSFLIVGILCLVVIVSLVCAFVFSHHLVGSFTRVIRELDEVLISQSRRTISTRNGDHLMNELLKRINLLIKRDS